MMTGHPCESTPLPIQPSQGPLLSHWLALAAQPPDGPPHAEQGSTVIGQQMPPPSGAGVEPSGTPVSCEMPASPPSGPSGELDEVVPPQATAAMAKKKENPRSIKFGDMD
jgi:hypothetical protein